MKCSRLIVLLVAILLGCNSYKLSLVDGSEPLRPSFELNKGTGAMPISSIGVFNVNTNEMLWEVLGATELTRVTYGETPIGMKIGKEPSQLMPNVLYEFACSFGDRGMITKFIIQEENGRLKVKQVNN